MTQAQFNTRFKEDNPNWEVLTLTDRRLLYNECMQSFSLNGLITDKQRETWGHPNFLTTKKNKINCSAY